METNTDIKKEGNNKKSLDDKIRICFFILPAISAVIIFATLIICHTLGIVRDIFISTFPETYTATIEFLVRIFT